MTRPLSPCVNEDHFAVDADGTIRPQPWMAWRQVASVAAASVAKTYSPSAAGAGFLPGVPFLDGLFGAAGGLGGGLFGGGGAAASGNKNDLIHSIRASWLNDTPVPQWCYALVTRGGCRVTLQARSRAYLLLSTGAGKTAQPVKTVTSTMGCGADIGRAGVLAVGTGFCILEQRQNSVTIPVAAERVGWTAVAPGDTFTAVAELRFMSDLWESSTIDGGDMETESGFQSGDTRLDVFAVPILDPIVIIPPPTPPEVGVDGGDPSSSGLGSIDGGTPGSYVVTGTPDVLDGGDAGSAGAGAGGGGIPISPDPDLDGGDPFGAGTGLLDGGVP